MRAIHDDLTLLGGRAALVFAETEQWVTRERPFQPDEEEVRKVSIRYGVVVGRVGKPDAGRFVWKGVG